MGCQSRAGVIEVARSDIKVLTDWDDEEYPIAIYGAEWWLTKTEVLHLIEALTKALQSDPI